MLNTKKARKGIEHMELKFKHKGRDYILVIQCTEHKLRTAEGKGQTGNGVNLNSAELFDMTAYRSK